MKCASDVPFKWLRKKLTISENSREDYPEPLDNFAMTLLFYSPKPFHYICQVFNLLLPHESDGMQMLMGHQDSPISHSSSWKLKLLKKKVKTKMFLSNFWQMKWQSESTSHWWLKVFGLQRPWDQVSYWWHFTPCYRSSGDNGSSCQFILENAFGLLLDPFNVRGWKSQYSENMWKQIERHWCPHCWYNMWWSCHKPVHDVALGSFNLPRNSKSGLYPVRKQWWEAEHHFWYLSFDKACQKFVGRSESFDEQPKPANFVELCRKTSHSSDKWRSVCIKQAKKVSHWISLPKMKVFLAAQTLSRSVAEALRFCHSELNLSEFEGSEATEEFIKIFNDVFDVMNSKKIARK